MQAGVWFCVWLTAAPLLFGTGAGQAALPGSQVMQELIGELEKQVKQENWEAAAASTSALERHFHRRIWLMQLLGDEEEYESLERNMARVKVVVKERDRIQVLLVLVEIRTTLRQIFSL